MSLLGCRRFASPLGKCITVAHSFSFSFCAPFCFLALQRRLCTLEIVPDYGGLLFSTSLATRRGLCWVRRLPGVCVTAPRRSPVRAFDGEEQLQEDPSSTVQKEQVRLSTPASIGDKDAGRLLQLGSEYTNFDNTRNTEKQIAPSCSKEQAGSDCQCLVGISRAEYDIASSFMRQISGDTSRLTEASIENCSESDVESAGYPFQHNAGVLATEYGGSKRSFHMNRVFLDRKDGSGKLSVTTEGLHGVGLQQGWFPYLDQFRVKDRTLTSSEILEMLDPFLLEERKQRIERVVANRTYSLCPVIEGLVDLGNISAVFRSADALGFQSVHVISNETNKRYKKNRKVSMGSEKWLDAELWDATRECLETLRSRGYQIAVTHIADDTVSILDIDWTVPTAVVFGNEHKGVSEDAIQMSDIRCSIPMTGMADSFNVSVAAGIVLHHAVHDRIARLGKHGDLLPEEQKILSADFYLRHSSQTLSIIDRLVNKKQADKQSSMRSLLRGELEVDIEMPEYMRIK